MKARPQYGLVFDDINLYWWLHYNGTPLIKLPKTRAAKYLATKLIEELNAE